MAEIFNIDNGSRDNYRAAEDRNGLDDKIKDAMELLKTCTDPTTASIIVKLLTRYTFDGLRKSAPQILTLNYNK